MRSIPDNRLSPFAPLPRTDMRGKTREANPKRRRSAPDDRAVLIAALVFSCEAALSSQRKIRGSRKRGDSAHLIRARRGNKV